MNITEIIDKELERSKEPDPHIIGQRIIAKFSNEQREELLTSGAIARVIERIRITRALTTEQVRTGPTRFNILREKREVERINLGAGIWKIHADCNVSDLRSAAEQYKIRAEKETLKAEEFESEADELERSGCATVGDMLKRAKQQAA